MLSVGASPHAPVLRASLFLCRHYSGQDYWLALGKTLSMPSLLWVRLFHMLSLLWARLFHMPSLLWASLFLCCHYSVQDYLLALGKPLSHAVITPGKTLSIPSLLRASLYQFQKTFPLTLPVPHVKLISASSACSCLLNPVPWPLNLLSCPPPSPLYFLPIRGFLCEKKKKNKKKLLTEKFVRCIHVTCV